VGGRVDARDDTLRFCEEVAITVDTYKAHGLSGTTEAPDWPQLTLDEVDRLLRRYPQAGGAVRITSFSPRPFSAASVVETPHGKVFVKRHPRSVRDREGLMEEHRLSRYLAGRLELVLPAMVNSAGETVVLDGEWSYEVHPVAAGVDVYEDALSWTPFLNSGHAMAAGQAMARMHNAAEGYDAPARETRQLVTSFTVFAGEDPEQSMEAYLHERPLLKEYADKRNWSGTLHGLHMPLYGQLQPWLKYLRPLWTHNDLHASNLIWSDASDQAQVTGIIDFGLADRTNAVHDIATTIERNVVEWLRMDQGGSNIVHLNHLDALLAGYEDIRPLSYEDAQALVTMLPLVHCEFALSETDYFLSILQSEEKAFLAYEGYFVAHSQWFQGMQGQRLLEHMRRWADQPVRHHALTGGER